jgi:hypothetical protein
LDEDVGVVKVLEMEMKAEKWWVRWRNYRGRRAVRRPAGPSPSTFAETKIW